MALLLDDITDIMDDYRRDMFRQIFMSADLALPKLDYSVLQTRIYGNDSWIDSAHYVFEWPDFRHYANPTSLQFQIHKQLYFHPLKRVLLIKQFMEANCGSTDGSTS